METNMTTEKALDILERHNLWRRGADYVEATDPKLLGMALDKAIKVLRLSNFVGQSEQLVAFCRWYNQAIPSYETTEEEIVETYLRESN